MIHHYTKTFVLSCLVGLFIQSTPLHAASNEPGEDDWSLLFYKDNQSTPHCLFFKPKSRSLVDEVEALTKKSEGVQNILFFGKFDKDESKKYTEVGMKMALAFIREKKDSINETIKTVLSIHTKQEWKDYFKGESGPDETTIKIPFKFDESEDDETLGVSDYTSLDKKAGYQMMREAFGQIDTTQETLNEEEKKEEEPQGEQGQGGKPNNGDKGKKKEDKSKVQDKAKRDDILLGMSPTLIGISLTVVIVSGIPLYYYLANQKAKGYKIRIKA